MVRTTASGRRKEHTMSGTRFRVRYADVVATLALVMAAGGTAYAATALPKRSVGTPQLKPQAVTAAKLHEQAVTGPKLRAGSVTSDKVAAGGITRADLAAAAVGTDQLGDPGSVGTAVVADETLSLSDLAGGQNNPLTAGVGMEADSCASFSSLPVPGAQLGQLVTAAWLQAPPEGVIIASTRVSGPNAVALSICNLNSTTASVPGGATFRIVTFG
jgi:hypothetical protein